MHGKTRCTRFLSCTLIAAALACGGDGGGGGEADPGNPESRGGPFTDAQIATWAGVANLGEIDAANVAQTRATREDVRAYADLMLAEHAAAHERLQELVSADALAIEGSAETTDLMRQVEADLRSLEAAPDERFDRTYLDAQVALHAEVLVTLRDAMLPEVESPALRSELEAMAEAMEAHLADARALSGANP